MESKSGIYKKVGIAGLGAIGKALVEAFHRGVPGVKLHAVTTRSRAAAQAWLEDKGIETLLLSTSDLAECCDIIIECAPAHAFGEIARPVLKAGKQLVVVSSGALLTHYDLVDVARQYGGRILVPTGALLGLDALAAAAEGEINSVTMVTRKPVRGLVGAPYLKKNDIEIVEIDAPVLVFSGTVREAIAGFPANVNVAVSLSLAGVGPDRTTIEIWADPSVKRNTHKILVDSDSALLSMTIENIPSENPKTGRITAQSVVALLRKMSAPLVIGT